MLTSKLHDIINKKLNDDLTTPKIFITTVANQVIINSPRGAGTINNLNDLGYMTINIMCNHLMEVQELRTALNNALPEFFDEIIVILDNVSRLDPECLLEIDNIAKSSKSTLLNIVRVN